jgi:uncharacterized protein YigA (DUF484 family)
VTVTEFRQEAASELADESAMTASELAEWLAGEVKRICAAAAQQLMLQRLEAGIQTDFTPQDAVLMQLKASRVVDRLVNLRQDDLLVEGNRLGLSNPVMASPLGLKAGETVRQRLLARGVGATRLAG